MTSCKKISACTPSNSEDFVELQIRQKHSVEIEMQHRDEKKDNLVIMGFDRDDGSVLAGEERANDTTNKDLQRVRECFREMNANQETGVKPSDIKRAFRMGKQQQPTDGKPHLRPLKLILANGDTKLGVMRYAREGLLNQGAFVRADLTPMQRGQRRKAKDILVEIRKRAPNRQFVLRDSSEGYVKIFERVAVQGRRPQLNMLIDPLICNNSNTDAILTQLLS